jgi:hypothetical protein
MDASACNDGRRPGRIATFKHEDELDGERVGPGARCTRVLGSELGGFARSGVAAIGTASGRITNWKPRISGGDVEGVAVAGPTVFIAGNFTRVGTHRRNGLAAFDRRNGRILHWNPRTGGRWDAITLANGVVYVTAKTTTTRMRACFPRSMRAADRRFGIVRSTTSGT